MDDIHDDDECDDKENDVDGVSLWLIENFHMFCFVSYMLSIAPMFRWLEYGRAVTFLPLLISLAGH